MKKMNCPKCGKELIRLEPYQPGLYLFLCDDCDLELTVWNKKETRGWFKKDVMHNKQKSVLNDQLVRDVKGKLEWGD